MLTEAELTVLRNAKTPEEIRHALNPVARALRDIFLKSSKVQAKKILNGKPVNRVNAAYAESTTTLRNRLEMVKANKNHVDHIMELWELLEVDLILGRAASILEYAARKLLFNSKSNLAQLEGNLNILKNQFLSFIHKYKIEGNDIQTAFDILIPEHLQGSLISYFRKCIPKLNTLKREIEEIIRKNPGYEHLAKDLERLNKYIRLLETLTGNGPFMYIGLGGGEIDEKLFDIANVSLIEELSTNEQIDESITYAEYTNYFNELLGIRKELIKNLDSELDKVKDILIKASNMENAEIKLNKENKRLTAASSTMENIDGGFRKNKTLNRKKMVRKTRKLGGGPLNRTAMIIGKELARKAAQGALKSEPFAQTAFKMAPMAFGTQLGNPALRKFSTNSRPFNNPKGAITKPKESSWTSENSKKNDHYWYDYMHNIEDNIKQSHESANFARQQMNKIFPPGRPKSINPNKKAKIATESQENLYGGTRRRRRHSKKHRTRKH
jgi:hypothetical protein